MIATLATTALFAFAGAFAWATIADGLGTGIRYLRTGSLDAG